MNLYLKIIVAMVTQIVLMDLMNVMMDVLTCVMRLVQMMEE